LEFDFAALSSERRYSLLTGLIVPRPIAFVSSLSRDGTRNAAPFSFFNMVGADPPIIVLGINPRAELPKDSFRNIVDTGEFVVNVVSVALADKANACSADFTPDVDEFSAVGLTAAPSRIVKPPRIAEAPASLECRLFQVVPITGKRSIVLGEIVYVHVMDGVLQGHRIDQAKLDAIGRMGGAEYALTRERISIARPQNPTVLLKEAAERELKA
jgi:flavin reductase (DIM6/NTAB) family NADH-FMN oxidoreductase RutF